MHIVCWKALLSYHSVRTVFLVARQPTIIKADSYIGHIRRHTHTRVRVPADMSYIGVSLDDNWLTSDKKISVKAFVRLRHSFVCLVSQKLDLSRNKMGDIPFELSGLKNLKELHLNDNLISEILVDVLKYLTALTFIDLSMQFGPDDRWPILRGPGGQMLSMKIPSSLLPILHPGLLKLDLQQRQCLVWDAASQAHLDCALAAVTDRDPPLSLLF